MGTDSKETVLFLTNHSGQTLCSGGALPSLYVPIAPTTLEGPKEAKTEALAEWQRCLGRYAVDRKSFVSPFFSWPPLVVCHSSRMDSSRLECRIYELQEKARSGFSGI